MKHAPLEYWRNWLIAAGRPTTTVRLRTYRLTRLADTYPNLLTVTPEHLASWLAGHDWSLETRRSFRAALRSFYGWAHASGLTSSDPSRLLPPIRPVKHRARPAPDAAVRCGMSASDRRVRLMVTLAARQGLRRGEIARVHSDDLVEDLLGWSLNVHGKGGKDRLIPLADDVAAQLLALPHGWAFPGRIDGHLSAGYVGKLVGDALPGGWSAHTLRHRFATNAYAGTRDLLAVQELLGHSRPETTRDYIELPRDSLREAVLKAA